MISATQIIGILRLLICNIFRCLLLPKQTRYQAALRPALISNTFEYTLGFQKSLLNIPTNSYAFPQIPGFWAQMGRKSKQSFFNIIKDRQHGNAYR